MFYGNAVEERADNGKNKKKERVVLSKAIAMMPTQDDLDRVFRVKVVRLILCGQAEQALLSLSLHYSVKAPDLRVGTVKGHRHVLACYVHRKNRIYVKKSDLLTNPFVILHEFYHHLRASGIQGRGQVEKRADSFALAFIREFNKVR
jgi:hypothetical protein